MLKRYQDHELGESASRRVSYHCTADYAKSSKSTCRVCAKKIEQDDLRLALMLQDDEGYKSTAWTHYNCFWKHPETRKLDGIHEIHDFNKLKAADRTKISKEFDNFNAKKTRSKRKPKFTSIAPDEDNSDDEDYSPESKSSSKKVTKKSPASNKRKRVVEED